MSTACRPRCGAGSAARPSRGLTGSLLADAATETPIAGDEAVADEPGSDPLRVGAGSGDDVVDVVEAAGGGLRLEVVDDELADSLATPVPGDDERYLRVAPLTVEPAVADDDAGRIGDVPPFIGDRAAAHGRRQRGGRQFRRAEQPLLVRVPARVVFPDPLKSAGHRASLDTVPVSTPLNAIVPWPTVNAAGQTAGSSRARLEWPG